ncbi:hypothetical protein V6N13_134234 [Hibiscus sabdariffa]|uniref:DUF7792 domain-containing protein n=1 Tax=Hibiscus sabdariffa TaxID=183260 RepID=A0ABR2R3Z8_9ROSI
MVSRDARTKKQSFSWANNIPRKQISSRKAYRHSYHKNKKAISSRKETEFLAMADSDQTKMMEDKLKSSVNLVKRVFFAFDEVESMLPRKNKIEVESFLRQRLEVQNRLDQLSFLLNTLRRFIRDTAKKPLYLRPLDLILDEVQRILNHALDVADNFNLKSVIRWLFQATKSTDFKPLFGSLDDCIANVKWLLTLYDPINNGVIEGIVVFLPPFIANNPMFVMVWHCIATVQMGRRVSDRIDAIKSIVSLAENNELYKKYFEQEKGVPPLLKLLENGACFYEQIAAADALCTLTNESEILEKIMIVIHHLLKDAPIEVQIQAAELVTEMTELFQTTQNDSVQQNVILPLVTILSSTDDSEVNLQKHELKTRCAEALWTLAARSKTNCMTITKTKAMLSLAKLVENGRGKLQYYCLMTIMEITAVAESDIHFRRIVFKTNASSTKAVVDQLLRVTRESKNPIQLIPAIRSIGSLARIFSSGETRIIPLLVSLLNNKHLTVASEAEIALKKFTSPFNYLCFEHWQSVMKYISLPALMRLIGGGNKLQRHRWDVDVVIILCLFYGYQHLRGCYSLSSKSGKNWRENDYECLASSPRRSYEFMFFHIQL